MKVFTFVYLFLSFLLYLTAILSSTSASFDTDSSLQTFNVRQLAKELPICPAVIKSYSEQFCQCPVSAGCGGPLPTFKDNLNPALTGRYISAFDIAQSLVDTRIIRVLSAERRGPGVGIGTINAANTCHMIKSEYGYNEAVVITTGTVQRSRLMANDNVLQGSTDNSDRNTFYQASDVFSDARDCSELYFTLEVKNETVTTSALRVAMQYMFLSEEYPEFVDNIFSDDFYFLIREFNSGAQYEDLAKVRKNGELIPVSINSVNYDEAFASIFRLCSPNTIFDGNTVNLYSVAKNLLPGKVYEVRLIVCDVGDVQYDSAVFIKKGSLTECIEEQPKINCPNDYESCPNAPIPRPVAQGNCFLDIASVLLTPVDTSVLGTISGVTFGVKDYPDVTCSFDLTINNRAPTIYSPQGTPLFTMNRSGIVETWDGITSQPRKFEVGEIVQLTFAVEDDCCAVGNTGKVFADAVLLTQFGWVNENVISVPINITKAFGQRTTIVIEIQDCYGILTKRTIDIEINQLCTGIALPFVSIEGGTKPDYALGTNVSIIVLIPEANIPARVELNGVVLKQYAPVPAKSTFKFYFAPSQCGSYDLVFYFDNLCTGAVNLKKSLLFVCPTPTPTPTASPTATPTPTPTPTPTATPTATPTTVPTASPTAAPTGKPNCNCTCDDTDSDSDSEFNELIHFEIERTESFESGAVSDSETNCTCICAPDTDSDSDSESTPTPSPVVTASPTATPSPVVTASPTSTPSPSVTASPSPSPSCEPGFKKNPISSKCEKTCSSGSDCVTGGVCSGECLSNGFCKDGQGSCRLGCCKATPGNIPLVVANAICSNGCGANSCCFENILEGCNSLNSPAALEETCTALYGKKIACKPKSESIDCKGHGIERCIEVKNGNINDSYCSASCTSTKPCSSGYKCVQFTKSYTSTPAIYGGSQMSFCVPNALTA